MEPVVVCGPFMMSFIAYCHSCIEDQENLFVPYLLEFGWTCIILVASKLCFILILHILSLVLSSMMQIPKRPPSYIAIFMVYS
jgi:hypothetical protein